MEAKDTKKSILMLPWLAHGHISPFFELAKKLSKFPYFSLHLCSTPRNLEPIRANNHNNHNPSSVQFIEIELPSSEELPPKYHSTKDLPPHLNSTLIAAFDDAKPAFAKILKQLKPDIVIYDLFQTYWAPQVARELGIKPIMFVIVGAASKSFLFHYWKYDHSTDPYTRLSLPENEPGDVVKFINTTVNGTSIKDRISQCVAGSTNSILLRTSREFEAEHIDYVSQLTGKQIVPVGIFVQEPSYTDEDPTVMDWLSKKDPHSVVYISFGSEYFLSKEEIEEITRGLELSNANFIWVVRFPARDDRLATDKALLKGLSEKIGEKGMLLEGWAPQTKILGHSSVGGFVSHCGWGSTLEGIYFGVPILALPMKLDQPLHAKLLEDEIGVGIEVKRVDGKIKGEELARVIKKVVGEEEEGKKIRRKAKELSMRVREKGDEEMNDVVEKLMNLVNK